MVQQYRTLTWLLSQPRQQQPTHTLGRHGLTSLWQLLGCRGGHYSPVFQLSVWTLPKTPHPLKHSPGKASCSYWRQAEDGTAASTEQRSIKTSGTSMARELQLPCWTPDPSTALPPPPRWPQQRDHTPHAGGKGMLYLGMSGGQLKRESF